MSSFFVSLLFWYSAHSCSYPQVEDGTLFVKSLELLDVTDKNSALVTIRAYNEDDTGCKVFNADDGTVGDIVSCDDYADDIRAFSSGDTDPTETSIVSLTNTDNNQSTIVIQRNNEEITIDNVPTYAATAYSHFFTINSLYTTYITFPKESWPNPMAMIALEFNGENNNTYTLYEVNTIGDWYDYDYGYVDYDVKVYDAVNLIELPLVCCLCEADFVAKYDISLDTETHQYNFTITTREWGADVDVDGMKLYHTGFVSERVAVYDLNDDSLNSYDLDLSSGTSTTTLPLGSSQAVICKPIVISTMIGLAIYLFSN